jgi:hypothetical protein
VLIAAVSVGALGLVREWNGQDGRWLLLASGFAVSLVIVHSRARDGSSRWTERTVFVVFAGGVVGLVLAAVQPDATPVVALGVVGVSLLTVRTPLRKQCSVCGQRTNASGDGCRCTQSDSGAGKGPGDLW